MTTNGQVRAGLTGPSEGLALLAGGRGTIFKLWAEELNGRISIVEHPIEPGVLVPPHVHSREDQIALVLEGTVGMLVGDQTLLCPPGSYVCKPRGLPHAFWNQTSQPARLAEICVPGGVERYMQRLFEQLIDHKGSPNPQFLHALAEEYGIRLVPELAIQLSAQHGVRLMGTRPPAGIDESAGAVRS